MRKTATLWILMVSCLILGGRGVWLNLYPENGMESLLGGISVSGCILGAWAFMLLIIRARPEFSNALAFIAAIVCIIGQLVIAIQLIFNGIDERLIGDAIISFTLIVWFLWASKRYKPRALSRPPPLVSDPDEWSTISEDYWNRRARKRNDN